MTKVVGLVLAAGMGSRMSSAKPKPLLKVGEFTMLEHILLTLSQLEVDQQIVVVNKKIDLSCIIPGVSYNNCDVVIQDQQLGTAHAVLVAEDQIKFDKGVLLIMYADTPLVEKADLQKLIKLISSGVDVAILSFHSNTPNAYGRLFMEGDKVLSIVEHGEDFGQDDKSWLCNSGVMAISLNKAWPLLHSLDNNNKKQEYYLTDIVKVANEEGLSCRTVTCLPDTLEGANDETELARLEKLFQKKKRTEMLKAGVQMKDPDTVHFALDTQIAAGVVIYPNVFFHAGVKIAKGSVVLPYCVLEGTIIGEDTTFGPFARTRPNSDISPKSKIGNFVEIKNSKIGSATKINHLSYIGDVNIGEHTNIGAGTIICNYDGQNKHFSKIGDNVFIGSHTTLISPVVIDDRATVAAGTVVSKDVESDSLSISRGSQRSIKNWRKNK